MPKKTRKLVRKMYEWPNAGTIHCLKGHPWTEPVFVIRQADVPALMERADGLYGDWLLSESTEDFPAYLLRRLGLVPPPAKKGGGK